MVVNEINTRLAPHRYPDVIFRTSQSPQLGDNCDKAKSSLARAGATNSGRLRSHD